MDEISRYANSLPGFSRGSIFSTTCVISPIVVHTQPSGNVRSSRIMDHASRNQRRVQLIQQYPEVGAKLLARAEQPAASEEFSAAQIVFADRQVHTHVLGDLVQPPALFGRELPPCLFLRRQPVLVPRPHDLWEGH